MHHHETQREDWGIVLHGPSSHTKICIECNFCAANRSRNTQSQWAFNFRHWNHKQDWRLSQYSFSLPPRLLVSCTCPHFKDNTASLPVACSLASRHSSCMHEEDQPTGAGGKSNSIRDAGFNSFLRDPLLIHLGRGFTCWVCRSLFNLSWEKLRFLLRSLNRANLNSGSVTVVTYSCELNLLAGRFSPTSFLQPPARPNGAVWHTVSFPHSYSRSPSECIDLRKFTSLETPKSQLENKINPSII